MFSSLTPQQIRNNPINNSSAKQQWSFSKASRFAQPKPSQSVGHYRSSLSTRKASIGYGNRSKFFDGNNETIDPSAYTLSSSF